MSTDILQIAQRLQALAQTGLAFITNEFDIARYREVLDLSVRLACTVSDLQSEPLRIAWSSEKGYATPKLDVRGGLFENGRIMLVREKSDGLWTLPGGYADVGDSPSIAIEREFVEEAGRTVRATKLAALYDRNKHPHTPFAFHCFKAFFICDELPGTAELPDNPETDAVDFFPLSDLPPLSIARVTEGQIRRLFEHRADPSLPTDFD